MTISLVPHTQDTDDAETAADQPPVREPIVPLNQILQGDWCLMNSLPEKPVICFATHLIIYSSAVNLVPPRQFNRHMRRRKPVTTYDTMDAYGPCFTAKGTLC